MRRSRAVALAALAAGLVSAGVAPLRPAPAASPHLNVVFLLSDDQRWDTLGAMGNSIIQTPNLDRLAAEGTLFTNAFCTTSICPVSRATILTGQWRRRHGIHDFTTPVSDAQWPLVYPSLLRAAGYTVGFIGKWGIGGSLPEERFDFWAGFPGQGVYFEPGVEGHLTARQAALGEAFLTTAKEPFCLQLSFKAPHAWDGAPRLFPPDPVDEPLYADVEIPRPRTATDANFQAQPVFIRTSEGHVRYMDRFTPELFEATSRDYYRLVTGMDRAVGQLRAVLEKRGVLDHTIIVFCSDNGLFMGEHGMADKWLPYEESIRIPMIVWWPLQPPEARGVPRDEMVLNVDVTPTILEAAGVPVPAGMQGESLLPLVAGGKPAWRTDFLYEYDTPAGAAIPYSEGVRTRRFKWLRFTEQTPPYEQLFDLWNDPYEENDLLHPNLDLETDLTARRILNIRRRLKARFDVLDAKLR